MTNEEAKQELYKTFLNYQILGADFAEKQKHETINSALTAGPTIDCTTATISVNNDWQIVKDISNASDIVYKDKSLNELIEDILNRLDRLERWN